MKKTTFLISAIMVLILGCKTESQRENEEIDFKIDSLHRQASADSVKFECIEKLVNAGLTYEEATKRYDSIIKTK